VSKLKRELSIDEKRLWRRVVEGVRARMPMPEAVEGAPARIAPPSRMRTAAPLLQTRAAALAPLADRAGEKRVRRGRVDIGASLDLHGHTQVSARAALAAFLQAAQARGERTVVIVTGVGRGGEGVLRRQLPEWLAERDLRTLVSGYAQAHRTHGGSGAYYVFLKRPRA
jgi:DNA-nicking Smr family endonuclease